MNFVSFRRGNERFALRSKHTSDIQIPTHAPSVSARSPAFGFSNIKPTPLRSRSPGRARGLPMQRSGWICLSLTGEGRLICASVRDRLAFAAFQTRRLTAQLAAVMPSNGIAASGHEVAGHVIGRGHGSRSGGFGCSLSLRRQRDHIGLFPSHRENSLISSTRARARTHAQD